jgi:transposase
MSLIFYYSALGKSKFVFWLDNAKTHKKKMKKLLDELLEEFGLKNQVKIKFIHIPPYSPKMNAAEYFIQIIRKRFLKNMVPNQNMEQVLTRLLPNVNHKRLLTQEQMRNILTRIKRIITQKKTTFIVE